MSNSDSAINHEFTTINMLIKEFVYSGEWEKDTQELFEDMICNASIDVIMEVEEMLPSIIGGIMSAGVYNDKSYEFTVAALAFCLACNFTQDDVVPENVIQQFEKELKNCHV